MTLFFTFVLLAPLQEPSLVAVDFVEDGGQAVNPQRTVLIGLLLIEHIIEYCDEESLRRFWAAHLLYGLERVEPGLVENHRCKIFFHVILSSDIGYRSGAYPLIVIIPEN